MSAAHYAMMKDLRSRIEALERAEKERAEKEAQKAPEKPAQTLSLPKGTKAA